jgi:hypothetical protein
MFLQGDKVNYIGQKFSSDLGGKMGEVCAPVTNQQGVYVVSFGDGDYVLNAGVLAPFQGHLRAGTDENKQSDKKEKKSKGPQVEHRRRPSQEEDSETE